MFISDKFSFDLGFEPALTNQKNYGSLQLEFYLIIPVLPVYAKTAGESK